MDAYTAPKAHVSSGERLVILTVVLGNIVGSAMLAGLLGPDRSDAASFGRVFVIVLITAAASATVVGFGLQVRPEAHGVGSSGTAGGASLGGSVADPGWGFPRR